MATDQTAIDPTSAPQIVEEREPMLLLDVTGSQNYAAAAGSSVTRKQVMQEALGLLVQNLAAQDSQASHEEDGGGLMTVTFANNTAAKLGDLNPQNFHTLWNSIRWGGGTYIMPGWRKIQQVYQEEFGTKPPDERPKLLLLVLTDGEADDTASFAQALSQIGGGTFVEIVITGYGAEHDQAFAAYQRVEQANQAHVRVTSLDSETNPETVARTLLRMIE